MSDLLAAFIAPVAPASPKGIGPVVAGEEGLFADALAAFTEAEPYPASSEENPSAPAEPEPDRVPWHISLVSEDTMPPKPEASLRFEGIAALTDSEPNITPAFATNTPLVEIVPASEVSHGFSKAFEAVEVRPSEAPTPLRTPAGEEAPKPTATAFVSPLLVQKPGKAVRVLWNAPVAAQEVSGMVGAPAVPEQQERSLWALWGERQIAVQASPQAQSGARVAHVSQAVAEPQVNPALVQANPSQPLDTDLFQGSMGGDLGAQSGDPQQRGETARLGLMVRGGEEGGEKFEMSAANVDVMVAPKTEASHQVSSVRRAVLSALREATPQTSGLQAGSSEARVELSVDGETIVIHVRVKDGVVDVDVAGLTRAELNGLRDELREQLPHSGLDLGDLKQGEDPETSEQEADGWQELEEDDTERLVKRAAPQVQPVGDGLWIKA